MTETSSSCPCCAARLLAEKANEQAQRALYDLHHSTVAGLQEENERLRAELAQLRERPFADLAFDMATQAQNASQEYTAQLRAERDSLAADFDELKADSDKLAEGWSILHGRYVAVMTSRHRLLRALGVLRERGRAVLSEAGALYKTLQTIRRDVHFADRTVDTDPDKWEPLCSSIMRQIDEALPRAKFGEKAAARLWDEQRAIDNKPLTLE